MENNRREKVLVTADNHIDCTSHGVFRSRTGLNSRSTEFLKVLAWLVEEAIIQNCTSFVIAGDLFNSTHPSLDIIREVKRILSGFPERVIIVSGNHEVHGNSKRTSPIDLLQDSKILIYRKLEWIDPYSIALPYPIIDQYLTENEMRLPQMEKEKLVVLEVLKRIHEMLSTSLIPSNEITIYGHVSVEGATLGFFQRSNSLDFEFPLKDLKDLGVKSIFLGHIHIPQVFSQSPLIQYVGAPVVQEFGQNYTPGYVIIDSKGWKHYNISEAISPKPKVVELEIESLTAEELIKRIREEVLPNGIIRLKLFCSRDKRKIFSEYDLREAMSNAQRGFIVWQHPEEKKELAEVVIDATPSLLVDQFFESQGLNSSLKTELLKIAEQIMRENK